MSEFTVTRQHRHPDGEFIVEVSQGGIDGANPGMYSPKWEGEGETFQGLTPAVSAAIAIVKAWQLATPQEEIRIAIGNSHGGMASHFDDEEATEDTFSAMLIEAEEFDAKLPKCAHCAEMLGKQTYNCFDAMDETEHCCSEYCAEERYRESLPEDDEEGDD